MKIVETINTPVVVIGYKRPDNIKIIIDILLKSQVKNIYVYVNGNIDENDKLENIKTKELVREYSKLHQNIYVLMKEKNTGLKYNIPEAINWVFKYHDRTIILEDDCVPNQSFFKFCEELLIRYYSELKIGQISGSNFLNARKFKYNNTESYLFSKIVNCWGWATWKNRWHNIHDIEMSRWPEIKKQNHILDFFENKKDARYFKKIFNQSYPNKILWDRAWFLTHIINKRLSIIPNKNLITNIGYDEKASGPNPKKYDSLELEEMDFPLKHPEKIVINKLVDDFLISEGFSNPSLKYRILNRLKRYNFLNYLFK